MPRIMDWVRCNICFEPPVNEKSNVPRRFFITNCGHIYCANCVNDGTGRGEKCSMCGKACTTEALDKIKGDVLEYFQDPTHYLKKALKTMNFQSEHKKRYAVFCNRQAKKIRQMEQTAQEMTSRLQQVEEENKSLKKENDCLKQKLAETKNAEKQTPTNKPSPDWRRPACTPSHLAPQPLPPPSASTNSSSSSSRPLVTPNRVSLPRNPYPHQHQPQSYSYQKLQPPSHPSSHSGTFNSNRMVSGGRPPPHYNMKTPAQQHGISVTSNTFTPNWMAPVNISRGNPHMNLGQRIQMQHFQPSGRIVSGTSVFSGLHK